MGAMMLFGLVPIALAVNLAWSADHWVETPIEVIAAEVRQSEAGNRMPVRETQAVYRYRFGRFTYLGNRIGVHLPVADNIGGWQQRWAEVLAAGKNPDGRPLTAWVDPDHPEQAVLDRSLRWGLLIFYAIFVVPPIWPTYLAVRALVARARLRTLAK
jgi:hypothetical protein